MTAQPLFLDSYAARSCPFKTINAFTAGLTTPDAVPLPPFFHDADAVTASVLDELASSGASVADLRRLAPEGSRRVEAATVAAMRAGVGVILAPVLPRDMAGHRSGHPSALLRRGDGYVPILVKFHRCLENASPESPGLIFSTLAEPSQLLADPAHQFRWRSRTNTALQAAHYWRLLEASGFAASVPVAGVVGTERLAVPGAASRHQHAVISWLDLDAPAVEPSPEPGAVSDAADLVSVLQRYDAEHTLRVDLAQAARAGDLPEAYQSPAIYRECDFCRWHDHCTQVVAADDLSLRIRKARLDRPEVLALRELGITSVHDLAHADLDALLDDYLPRTRGRSGAEDRLRLAQRRARMLADGIELERLSEGPLDLPRHALEIDLDIETSADDHAYLWGFYLDDGVTRTYKAFARFEPMTDAAEQALAEEAFGWLRAVTAGRDVAVYHYSDYEVIRVHRLAAALDDDLAWWADDYAHRAFVDLFQVVKRNFFGASGLGLKVVATHGAGFTWRDEEPGGLASQSWFADAVSAPTAAAREAARRRVLEYNEDDCRATHALRAWLRSLG